MHALRQPERNLDVLRAEVFRILGRSSVGRAAGSDSAGRQFDPDRPIQVLLGRSSVLSSGFDPAGRTSPSYRPSPWGVGKWLSHRFLVPVFVGSNPTSPAKQTVSLPASRERSRTASDNNPANGRGTSGGRHSDGVGRSSRAYPILFGRTPTVAGRTQHLEGPGFLFSLGRDGYWRWALNPTAEGSTPSAPSTNARSPNRFRSGL